MNLQKIDRTTVQNVEQNYCIKKKEESQNV